MTQHSNAWYRQQLHRLTNLVVSKQTVAFDLSIEVLLYGLD